jgi:hypothetical protein
MSQLRFIAILCLLLPACVFDDDADPADDVSETSAALQGPGDDDPPECDDGNPCTKDTIRFGGCRYTQLANGTSCDDGDLCNGVGRCQTGTCVTSAPLSCNDGNSCTDDWCEPALGCVSEDNTASCSDGNSCTVGDVCSSGVCEGVGSTSGTIGAPAITDVVVSAAAGLIDRAPVYYLEGDVLDVDLTVPSCTYVTSVRLGDATLTTAPRTACGEFDFPRDCEPNFYTIESDLLQPDGSRRLRVRLHLTPSTKDGASKPVRIIAASALGEATYDLVLARVADVKPDFIELTIADADFHDEFIGAVFAGYGDDASQQLASGGTIHDPDYNATRMQILGENKLRVLLDFSARQDYWCDPRVHVDATYALAVDGDQVSALRQPDATSVMIDFAWYCDLLGGFFQGIQAGMAEDGVVAAVDASMGDLAAELTGALCQPGPGGCTGITLSSVPGELRVKLLNTYESVAFDVAYNPNGATFPSPSGLPLRAGENVVVTAAGIVAGCDFPTAPSDACFGAAMGPAGVPNRNVASGPAAPQVPPATDPDGTYHAERAEARAAMTMLTRDASALPRPAAPVGALLAKLGSAAAPSVIGTGPCQIATPAQDLLGFGANDRTRADSLQYGRGQRRVTVVFTAPTAAIPPCAP